MVLAVVGDCSRGVRRVLVCGGQGMVERQERTTASTFAARCARGCDIRVPHSAAAEHEILR